MMNTDDLCTRITSVDVGLDLQVSPLRSQSSTQGSTQGSSSSGQFRQIQSGIFATKQRPLVSKPSPPPFNSSGRGAKQLAKAMEMQQKQQQIMEYSSSVVSGSSPLLGRQPINDELTFVMCYGSTPCFAKVVSNPSSCRNAASESIMINPFRVNPLNDRLLMSWSGVVWLAKRQSIRPVQMSMEPGGYRVVDSPEVREFIDLMVSKGRLTYPIDIEHRQDVDCDMVSLDSGSTDNNSIQVDLTLYPKLPPSSSLLRTVKSSPSKADPSCLRASEDVSIRNGVSSGVAQVTPTTAPATATATAAIVHCSSSSRSNSDYLKPFHYPISAPRPKPRLDLINSSYYQNTIPYDGCTVGAGQSCSTPTESDLLVRVNSVSSSSGGGGAKSVRFTDDLTSPSTTVESIGGGSSVVLDSPVTLVFEGIASSQTSSSSADVDPAVALNAVPSFALSPSNLSVSRSEEQCTTIEPVVVAVEEFLSPPDEVDASAVVVVVQAESPVVSSDMDLLADVCKQRSESVTSESDCYSVEAMSSCASGDVNMERFMSPVPSIAEPSLLAESICTPESTSTYVDRKIADSGMTARCVGRKRGPAAAGLPPLAPSSTGKNKRNTKSSVVDHNQSSSVNSGILLEASQDQKVENASVQKRASKASGAAKAGSSGKTVAAPAVVSPVVESVGRVRRAASVHFVHRDAIFGTRPSSKQSAATGSWTIK